MNVPPLQPGPVPSRPHWTEPVSREETLARREKFQKIGWLPPNHKPKTKKDYRNGQEVLGEVYNLCLLTLPAWYHGAYS